jgi:uncharacterized protein
MNIYQEFVQIVDRLANKYPIPPISQVFFPKFYVDGQPKECEFISLQLESGACGISFVLLPNDARENYQDMADSDLVGMNPVVLAADFGSDDPVKNMVGLSALNAVCQEVMRVSEFKPDSASDSVGMLDLQPGDRVGMVGFFRPLVKRVEDLGAELIIFEQKEDLVSKNPHLNITLDSTLLKNCNKVLCTSTTVYNNTLDAVLGNCSPEAFISVIGPTAGYFPDPLFARGVDVVGGTFINDGPAFMQRLREEKKWGSATSKISFQKSRYSGLFQ